MENVPLISLPKKAQLLEIIIISIQIDYKIENFQTIQGLSISIYERRNIESYNNLCFLLFFLLRFSINITDTP